MHSVCDTYLTIKSSSVAAIFLKVIKWFSFAGGYVKIDDGNELRLGLLILSVRLGSQLLSLLI